MQSDDVITAVVLVALLGAAVWKLPWGKLQMLGARSWLTSPGKIEFGTVLEQRTRYFNYYLAQMAYSYAVNGEYYSGYYEKMFFRESSAQKFADELKGKAAFVRHKANSPQVSTLLREDQQSVWPLQR